MRKLKKYSLTTLFRWIVLLFLSILLNYAIVNKIHIIFTVSITAIFILLLFAPALIHLLLKFKKWRKERQINTAFKNGGDVCIGEIKSIKESRRWLNNTTYVRFSVIYEFEREKFVAELRKVTDLQVIPGVGHKIEIVYDPKKDKVYFTDKVEESSRQTNRKGSYFY